MSFGFRPLSIAKPSHVSQRILTLIIGVGMVKIELYSMSFKIRLTFELVVNRWISARFNILSSFIVGVTAILVLVSPNISAAQAGFALAFSSTVSMEVSYSFFTSD